MNRKWVLDRSGMPPEHSQTLLGVFGKIILSTTHKPKSWKRPRAGKPFLSGNKRNKKDTHRHDSNFHGPMTSPSSIWSPFMKKRVLNPFLENEVIFGGRAIGRLEVGVQSFSEAALSADWKWGCGGCSPPPE